MKITTIVLGVAAAYLGTGVYFQLRHLKSAPAGRPFDVLAVVAWPFVPTK